MAMAPPFGELIWGQRAQSGGAPFPPPPDAATPAQGKAIPANYNVIGPDYFRALGVALQQGREFRSTEFTDPGAPRVAIINSTLAEKLWPGEAALGRTIQLAGGSEADDPGTGGFAPLGARPHEMFEVVGVAAPFKDEVLRRGDHSKVFVPYGQHYFGEMYLVVCNIRRRGVAFVTDWRLWRERLQKATR